MTPENMKKAEPLLGKLDRLVLAVDDVLGGGDVRLRVASPVADGRWQYIQIDKPAAEAVLNDRIAALKQELTQLGVQFSGDDPQLTITISGPQGSGKSTLAEWLRRQVPGQYRTHAGRVVALNPVIRVTGDD